MLVLYHSITNYKAIKVFKIWGKENGYDFIDEPAIDDAQN